MTGFSLIGLVRGLFGLLFIVGICYLLSENKRKISWKLVGSGLLIQFILGIGVIYVPFFYTIFEWIGRVFLHLIFFSKEGARFIFGDLVDSSKTGFIFAFQVLPAIVFFGALTGVLYYYGIIQKVVGFFAWLFQRVFNISGPESLATSANIFLGQSESPLLIRSYLEGMSRAEIFQLMVAGMSMLAGSVLALYIGFLGGNSYDQQLFFAKHLIAASVMAAPGTIVVAKIIIPQTESFERVSTLEKTEKASNVLGAIFNGTSDGLKLAINVAAMLIAFVAFIALFNYVAGKIGSSTNLNNAISLATHGKYQLLSLQFILGYCFSPVMWMIGVSPADITSVGSLLGEKIILTELVGYLHLGDLKAAGVFTEQKSIIMATYMLSGFANFASIGIQIACIGSLAPGQKALVSSIGFKAMVAGTLTSLLSACMVGMLI